MSIAPVASEDSRQALAAALGGGAGSARTGGAAQEMSDRFLKLLVTQLRNQDPLNPMENAELTTQLAQMSTVEGVNRLNQGLETLTSQFLASQAIQGASLVGRQVLAEGDLLDLSGVGAAGGVWLDGAADRVKVQVLDAAGATVRTLELGSRAAGLARFAWDGKDDNGVRLADGAYAFKAQVSAAGQNVAGTAYALGSVVSVALNGNGMEVEVSGLGSRGMNQIKQIF